MMMMKMISFYNDIDSDDITKILITVNVIMSFQQKGCAQRAHCLGKSCTIFQNHM